MPGVPRDPLMGILGVRNHMAPGDSDLEDRVEELEEATGQHREWLQKMMPDRRGVIKGLGAAAIGGAAVGGATGGASGQSAAGQVGTESEPVDVEGATGNFDTVSTDRVDMAESGHGPIISKQDADVKVYYGVETDNRSDYYVRAVNQDGIVDEFVGDIVGNSVEATKVIRSAIDATYNSSNPQRSGTLKIVSNTSQQINLGNPDTASESYFDFPEYVTVDIAGVNMGFVEDGLNAFTLSESTTFFAPGAYIKGGSPGVDNIWGLPSGSSSTSGAAKVLGFPEVTATKDDNYIFNLTQSDGGSVSNAHLEACAINASGAVSLRSTGTGGFVNDNNIYLNGSFTGAPSRGASTNTTYVDITGSAGNVNFNHIKAVDMQSKSADHAGRIEYGQQNEIVGTISDNGNVSQSTYYIGSSVGAPQNLTTFYGGTSVTNNSSYAMNFDHPIDRKFGQDLTVLSGFTNQIALHDGSGTPPKGVAVWDDTLASGSGNWRSQVDGSTFGPN